MSVHDSIALMVMHMIGTYLSLFVSWLCLDSQSVMNSCGPGLLNTDVFIIIFFGTCVICLQHLS